MFTESFQVHELAKVFKDAKGSVLLIIFLVIVFNTPYLEELLGDLLDSAYLALLFIWLALDLVLSKV